MAKPEIPSIVVHNGSASTPGSPSIEISSPDPMSPRSKLGCLRSGDEDLEDDITVCDASSIDLNCFTPALSNNSSTSLPVTPASPSPAVSSNSPSANSPLNSPGHLASNSSPAIPQGPGPGGGTTAPTTTTVLVEEPSPEEDIAPEVDMTGGPAASPSLTGIPSRSLEQQRSTDSEKDDSQSTSSRHRSFHGNKLKLLQRSHAMREDTSPPPTMDIMESAGPPMMTHGPHSNSLTVCHQGPPIGGPPTRRRLRHQGSSGGSFDGSSPCLSRDSSTEYTDNSGVDLLQFIIQTLHKNQKDRMLLLKIEKELINLVKDHKRSHHKFPQMSSYQRMLVHRCAAFFGLDHNVDHVGTCVIVNKTRSTRLPESRFKEHIRDELLPPDEPKRSILRRGYNSFEDPSSFRLSDRLHTIESRRSKSFEEREEEYEKSFSSMDGEPTHGRGRYPFDHRHYRRNSHDESRWFEGRHFEQHDPHVKHYDNHKLRGSVKGESFESQDSLNVRSLRPPVFKSNSFGGYSGGITVLARGDSVASNPSSRLSKQDSTGSRFSDHSSSSGYKTQRQDTSSTNVSNTLSTTPSPTAGQYQHPSFGQHAGVWGGDGDAQPVMWAVTDMEAVPSGAMLINPQSGQPFVNPDGSVYRYDPSNPPHVKSSYNFHKKDRESGLDKRQELQEESKGNSLELDECSEGSKNDRMKEIDSPSHGPPSSVPHSTYPSHHQYGAPPPLPHHIESRTYTQENVSELPSQFRSLSLSASSEPLSDIGPPSAAGTPLPHGFVVPRNQFSQPMYYVPPTSVANISGGGMKYVYPQYTHMGGQGHSVQAPPTHPSGSNPLQSLPSVGNLAPSMPGAPTPMAGHNIQEAAAPITPGYMPSNYTVVAYNPNGLLSTVTSTGTVQESGGTTYYCSIPPNAQGATNAPPPPPPPAPPSTNIQQYALTPTTTAASSTYPMALNFYSASGMGGNGMFQPQAGLQGYNPGMYGTPQPHGAQPPQAATVSFRAPTPPHTPSTQSVGIPLSFNSGGGGAVPPQGQYIVLNSQQPPTPTSHAPPQVFPAFFRPSMQTVWREMEEEAFERPPRS